MATYKRIHHPGVKNTLFDIFFIALGAFLGAIIRVGISHLSERFTYKGLPIATLTVNVGGSFLLGIVITILITPTAVYLFLVIGFLSSLTTFSTFVMELDTLWNSNKKYALQYAVLSLSLGFLLLLIGLNMGQLLSGA